MSVISVSRLELAKKCVLVRCDFNVPLNGSEIADTTRIDASLETVRFILQQGAAAILCSHLGRPKERTPELSLKPVAAYLSKALGRKVALAPDCIGEVTGRMARTLSFGDALMLENLRFHPEEEANDADFAHELARGKNVYVNDAFGAAHRAHASTAGVAAFIPERAAGFLMIRELDALKSFTENPAHPLIAILGGAKVSDKIGVIRNLMTKVGVDTFLIGGAMAYTFLKAQGLPVGGSRVEDDKLGLARELMEQAGGRNVDFILPQDHIVAEAPTPEAPARIVTAIDHGFIGLDIGPRTVEDFCSRISSARMVIWNGPLGLFE
ncbi:MAG: phosphoglycerate kinase, partial [Candidatus Binataceae bacterium]